MLREEHGPSSEAAPAWENYDARIAEIRTETDWLNVKL